MIFWIQIKEGKRGRGCRGWGGGGGPTVEKKEGFQFQISQGMNGKTGVPGENPLVGRRY